MKLSRQVLCAIDDAVAKKFDAALLHACIAIDATSKRLYPSSTKVGERYVNCLRHYYWLLEPMIGAGLNLVETQFTNLQLRKHKSPDLADVIYEIFRCSHAHGDEVPNAFSILPSEGGFHSRWLLGNGELHMPDRVIWALLSVAVLSQVNRSETTTGNYYLSLGAERFTISEWWGREHDFRIIADRYNKVRVRMDGLERLEKQTAGLAGRVERVQIFNPPCLSLNPVNPMPK
jgi:hypothetical protein